MIRRIFWNFSRKIPWTLCRIVLLALALGCFLASMLLDGLTKQLNTQLVSDADLYVSVYTKFNTDADKTKDGKEARSVLHDFIELDKTLNDENVLYTDVPITSPPVRNSREISWPLPEDDEIEYPMTTRALFMRKVYGADLVYDREWAQKNEENPEDFWFATKIMAESHGQSYEFVTVETPDFLKHHLGIVNLISGRLMTQEEIDSGAAVCLVPADSAIIYADGYKILEPGDTLQVTFYRYSDEIEMAVHGETDYKLLDSASQEMTVIGTYESSENLEVDTMSVYIPRPFFVQLLEAQDDFFENDGVTENYYFYKTFFSQPLIFQFDSLEHLEAFIGNLEARPDFQDGAIQYSANVDHTLHMLAGFYGIADGISSMLSIFGVIAVAFSILIAVLDVFYRRREIAILQSMGESPGKIITQFTLESLLMLAVSAALAAPAALRLMKGAVPSLFTEEAAEAALNTTNTFVSITSMIEEVTVDHAALIESLGYSSSDYIRIVLLLLLMAACCTAAVWIFTKKFNARNLLND